MERGIGPVLRQTLADDLAQRVQQLIRTGGYQPGDRLPAIMEMARSFGVGHPTLREALKKLQTVGVVDVRHGSGVYVLNTDDTLLVSNPVFNGAVSLKLLLDLMEARIPIETTTVALAARHATAEDLAGMTRSLEAAAANLGADAALHSANMTFHRQIAQASGNAVLSQILIVLSSLFQQEQRAILNIYGFRRRDHEEHLGILEALERKDESLAVERMRAHLEGVCGVLRESHAEGE